MGERGPLPATNRAARGTRGPVGGVLAAGADARRLRALQARTDDLEVLGLALLQEATLRRKRGKRLERAEVDLALRVLEASDRAALRAARIQATLAAVNGVRGKRSKWDGVL